MGVEHINITLGQPHVQAQQEMYGLQSCISCIPARKQKRVWKTTTSPKADHKARPTIKKWSTADRVCRQARTHNKFVKCNITPGSHVARLIAYIGVNHVVNTLGKDNKLDMVRNLCKTEQCSNGKISSARKTTYRPKQTHEDVAHVRIQSLAPITVQT